MYNEFCITGLTTSLANKQIIVETNFKLNPNSVTKETVIVKLEESEDPVEYTLVADNSNIIIEFTNWPLTDTNYSLTVTKDLEDALEREVNNPFVKTVNFESQVKHKIAVEKPSASEAIKDSIIKVLVKATPEDDLVKGYYYEIASDVAFCNVSNKLLTDLNEVEFTDLKDGQYFLRCREQDLKDENLFGQWSDVVDFVILKECICKEENKDNQFLEDLLSLDVVLTDIEPIEVLTVPANGRTQESIYIVFDKEIDPTSVPETVLALRRDL